MSIYTASAIGLVVTMIWGEVLFYLDGKVIPRIEGYFRRRRETNNKSNGGNSHASEGKCERGYRSY